MSRCRFRISVYFAAFIACIVVLDTTGIAVIALLCAAFHEAGHFAALFFCHVPIEEISFKIFGANIKLSGKTRIDYKQEVLIALAGCGANLLLCLISFVLLSIGVLTVMMSDIFIISLILCCFNILPIGPLDGGRVLEALICFKQDPDTAKKIVDILSVFMLFPLIICGYLLVVKTGYNFSLILACIYLVFSVVLKGRLLDFAT